MTIKLKGSTDGSVSFTAPADTSPTGSDITLTLPTTAGSANQFVKNSGTAGELEYSSMTEDSNGVVFCTSRVDALQFRCTADGTASLPSINPGFDNDTGFFRPATNTIGFSTTGSERMRIDNDGNLFVNTTDTSLHNNNSSSGQGLTYIADAELGVARWQNNVAYFNRMGNDGDILRFQGQGTTEGNIAVSGTSIGLNGAHLNRWSQLAGNAERIEILRGSVLSNLDEMCEWGEEDNEQLNRMKVSDVEGDVNVAGVFQSWDDDDDTYTNDFYCAMTGDFVIRIAQGTTVARGDLLMSAGDGTAKPQGDDIVRSKTIAKVTSTVVSETYADGSYCVPCVLMAC